MRACQPKICENKRESPGPLAPCFICFSPPPLGLLYVNWASRGAVFLPEVLTLVLGPLFYFHGLFPSLSCSHCHSGLFFPILTT